MMNRIGMRRMIDFIAAHSFLSCVSCPSYLSCFLILKRKTTETRTTEAASLQKKSSFFFSGKIVIIFCLLIQKAWALPGYHEPWGKDTDLVPPKEQIAVQQKPSIMVKLARQAILFHQNVLSKVDGPRSHFRPSSSQYMLLAMQKHGFIKGYFLGCDRLLRENDADWVYNKIDVGGKLMKYNPPP